MLLPHFAQVPQPIAGTGGFVRGCFAGVVGREGIVVEGAAQDGSRAGCPGGVGNGLGRAGFVLPLTPAAGTGAAPGGGFTPAKQACRISSTRRTSSGPRPASPSSRNTSSSKGTLP